MKKSYIIWVFLSLSSTTAFQSFRFPTFGQQAALSNRGNVEIEESLLTAILNNGSEKRLDNSDEIGSLVKRLEESGTSIKQPAIAPEVMGRWRLLHTNNADTASPIQRKAVDSTKFNIYQDITFSEDDPERLIVSQVVKFGDDSELRVDALASTSKYPLAELTERQSTGKILGLNILGVSKIGDEAKEDSERPDSRISFVFDEGKFDLKGFKIPYPVPFRNPLFRDAVKGWIDITYLSERVRISRGNKGTTFVLVKE